MSRSEIQAKNPVFLRAYEQLIEQANKELKKEIDPVTNKTVLPASGDTHDYHTVGSYYWPDESKPDGLPWVYKDGQFNPISNSAATDWQRRKEMLDSLGTLNIAYYFSDHEKYLEKAGEIVQVWFIDPETRMNPNVNYGKAIPGAAEGTNFAIIDWTDIGKVITSVQLLERAGLWNEQNKVAMDKWFSDYYTWLTTSEFGILEDTRKNNHGTNYDYQAIGLMIYLGKIKQAEAKIEAAKTTRIAAQIEPDGSQPLELARTKSVNYTVNNLWALARIADLSRRNTSVDLWDYERETGASIKQGFEFVIPYITGQKNWQWKQITGGGAKAQLNKLALPMVRRTELLLGEQIVSQDIGGYSKFNAMETLVYAPDF
ncbi:alginate lyase family protein [Alteromonas aestuariivivens]|nr:alginate lyase family protein [Alteromonas aestuariivivens]